MAVPPFSHQQGGSHHCISCWGLVGPGAGQRRPGGLGLARREGLAGQHTRPHPTPEGGPKAQVGGGGLFAGWGDFDRPGQHPLLVVGGSKVRQGLGSAVHFALNTQKWTVLVQMCHLKRNYAILGSSSDRVLGLKAVSEKENSQEENIRIELEGSQSNSENTI